VNLSDFATIQKADNNRYLNGRRILATTGSSKLKMEPIGKRKLLLFGFLGFRFFWNSSDGKAMPLLNGNPGWLAHLIIIPYILASLGDIHNLGAVKYFIKEENEVVGTAILKLHQDTLTISSLAVSPIKRKHGVAFFILRQAENIAKQLKIPWLEVEVLSSNVPAQRLYLKFGFKVYAGGRLTFVFRKQI